jgi:2-oxoglutarate ferredoxin oxidoreductase subunit delta
LKKKGFIRINRDLCKGCGLCIEACPKGTIIMSEKLNIKGYRPAEYTENENSKNRKCTGCALCAIVCPDVAIEVFRG